MLMRLKHNEVQRSQFAVYLQKTLYFLVFHRNIGLKTSIYEFSDRIHQNKQGFEGKKLSGKEFVAFEEYQRVCVQPARRFLLFSYLDFRVYLACYPPESFKIVCLTCIWSKCVDTSFHGRSSQTPQQNPCRISHLSKTWLRYANNRPGTGTSHIIMQNLWAKFGVTQTVNAKFCTFFSLKVLKLLVQDRVDYEQSPIFPQGQQSVQNASARENHPSREKATRGGEREKCRVSPFLAWGDFQARSHFARSTIPEEKWRTNRSLRTGRQFMSLDAYASKNKYDL